MIHFLVWIVQIQCNAPIRQETDLPSADLALDYRSEGPICVLASHLYNITIGNVFMCLKFYLKNSKKLNQADWCQYTFKLHVQLGTTKDIWETQIFMSDHNS